MVNEIKHAIYELQEKNIWPHQMVIVFPFVFLRTLESELYLEHSYISTIETGKLFGVEVWPYGSENEIQVYSKKNITLYPDQIVKIPLTVNLETHAHKNNPHPQR